MARDGYDIYVSGIVQGVGFRPFVKRIAYKSGVYGFVQNMGGGEVIIHLEGSKNSIRRFFQLFREEAPPPAEIIYMKISKAGVDGYKDFEIKRSGDNVFVRSIIPPDIGICDKCIKEIESNSRWHNYPFNSCAWCGPRFSMMYKIPYDRENTSMIEFSLCKSCKEEYEDIHNIRRFHVQGISCSGCGPKTWLVNNRGDVIKTEDPLHKTSLLLEEGYILGIKGIGGFHIACRADEDDIVNRLRIRKKRPYKPFALMAFDLDTVKKLTYLDEISEKLLISPQRPIVLLRKKGGAKISEYIAPGLDRIGIMLPYSGIHYLILRNMNLKYLVMTSGNYYNKPMETDNEIAIKRLGGIVDYFLLHNRKIVNRVDDSVLRISLGRPVFLRRSRGYAPRWIRIPTPLKETVIAFGSELQNVGGIGFEDKIVLTQYIGDTDEFENLLELQRYIKWFASIYRVNFSRSLLIIDKHSKYNSSILGMKWSEKFSSKIIKLQHHVAHAYSILAEYGARSGIVITIDGTGYGDDGNIWGGEVIEVEEDGNYNRVSHIMYYKLLGGDLAAIYPARILHSLLTQLYGLSYAEKYFLERGYVKYLRGEEELRMLTHIYDSGKLFTSSLGRLLDAFSTLLKICAYRSYEGEPAMKLEAAAYNGALIKKLLDIDNMLPNASSHEINISQLFMLAKELWEEKYSRRDLAFSIQYVLGLLLGHVASEYASSKGYKYIYISGGAAVNEFILKGVFSSSKEYGLLLRTHRVVPPGDGGISLGQIYATTYKPP